MVLTGQRTKTELVSKLVLAASRDGKAVSVLSVRPATERRRGAVVDLD